MKRILGIDPGSAHTGYACIEEHQNRYRVLTLGVWKPPANNHFSLVRSLWVNVCEWVESFSPNYVIVEDTFAHPQRPRALKKLAEMTGVILSALAYKNSHWILIPPARMKKTLTGNGRVSKQQVRKYLIRMFPELEHIHVENDAFDALALALCGILMNHSIQKSAFSTQSKKVVK